MTDYLYEEEFEADVGGKGVMHLLVRESSGKHHKIIAVPEKASDNEIRFAVNGLEDKLGYELEKPEDWDQVRHDVEEFDEKAKSAQLAGF